MTSGIISKGQHWLLSPSLKPTLLFTRAADIIRYYSAQTTGNETVTLLHNFSAFLGGVYTFYCGKCLYEAAGTQKSLGGVPESSLLLSFEKQGAASDSRTQEFLFLFGQKQLYFHRLKVKNKLSAAQFLFAIKSSPSDENKLRERVKFNRITGVWSQCTCGLEASLVAWINHGCNQRGAAVSGSL